MEPQTEVIAAMTDPRYAQLMQHYYYQLPMVTVPGDYFNGHTPETMTLDQF